MEPVVHKRHRIKFKKDLTGLNPKLRQSLLQIIEIEDMSKIYSTVKRKLGVSDRRVDPNQQPVRQEEPKKTMDITIEQRIELYKKRKSEEKLNEKIREFMKAKEKRPPQVQKTPMRRLISQLEKTGHNDDSSTYMDELKHSEQQLIYVKNNSRRRRSYSSQVPKRFSRSRVISMQTGLPLDNDFSFRPLEDFINQSRPIQKPKATFNIDGLAERLEEIYPISPKIKEKSSPEEPRHHTQAETEEAKDRKLLQKVRRNLNRSFKHSKDMTTTFANYVGAKKNTREQYNELVETWKVDRPFTNHLRRKNYQIVGRESLKDIEIYRQTAEEERQKILQQNRSFYLELVNFVLKEAKYLSDIPMTRHLCEGLRRNFELFNKFEGYDLKCIVDEAKEAAIPEDPISQQVLQKMRHYLLSK